MKFSEKVYSLRKKSGLSQEQLAEQLQVSRQAVSKWESGISVPESDKLIALSDYFGVSVDYLLKDGAEHAPNTDLDFRPLQRPTLQRRFYIHIGISLCVLGCIALILWGALLLTLPNLSKEAAAFSTIQIDGRGILLLIGFLPVVIGVTLLWKNQNRR